MSSSIAVCRLQLSVEPVVEKVKCVSCGQSVCLSVCLSLCLSVCVCLYMSSSIVVLSSCQWSRWWRKWNVCLVVSLRRTSLISWKSWSDVPSARVQVNWQHSVCVL